MGATDITIDRLAIGYRAGRRHSVVVAKELSGCVEEGQLTCLIGRNGSGKSTLLRTIAGFQPPISGRITIGGEDTKSMGRMRMARKVGVVLTSKPDIRNMTVAETVAMGRTPYTNFWGNMTAKDRQAVAEAISMAGIESLSAKPMGQLSDGERQKVMVAKALAQQTPALLLDEPTAFLDYPSKLSLMKLLLSLAHDTAKTILLSTHDVEMALHHADRLWLMDEGRLSVGEPSMMASDGTLQRYIGEQNELPHPSQKATS